MGGFLYSSLMVKVDGLYKIYYYYYYYYYNYNYLPPSELLPSALAGGLSLESEWQQVSSAFKDSSNCKLILIMLWPGFFLWFPAFLVFKPLGTIPKYSYYKWYHCHPHVQQIFFSSLTRSKYLSIFTFFYFFSMVLQNGKSHKFFFSS